MADSTSGSGNDEEQQLSSSKTSETLDRIFQSFMKRFKGVPPTIEQFKAEAKHLKLAVPLTKTISQYLRDKPELAIYAPAIKRPPVYQSLPVIRPGIYHIDYGEFHKSWARHNDNFTGFLVAVENFTNRLFVHPSKNKNSQSWLDAILYFVERTQEVSVIYSDRDAVATSSTFREFIQDKFNIRWHFLKTHHKAFLAETYIGKVKTRLSQALKFQTKQPQRWIDLVEPLMQAHNKQKIGNTPYTRQSVNRTNFDAFLKEFVGDAQPEMSFHASRAGPFKQEALNKRFFRYTLGSRVLLNKSANYSHDEKTHAFHKVSVEGGYGSKIYTVSGRQLRMNRQGNQLVAVYSLQELDPRRFHFYEAELRPAPNSSSSSNNRTSSTAATAATTAAAAAADGKK